MLYSWLQAGRRGAALGLLALAFAAGSAFAQAGRIEGTVRSATTGEPLVNVRVSVASGRLSAVTDARGFYRISDVPPGLYNVRGSLVGYTPVTISRLSVAAGLPATANMEMSPAVVSLEEVVVTGTVGATRKADLPFTVASVRSEDLPVPTMNAVQELQGKVAGAVITNSGRPGSTPSVLLRGATSIDASGRSQDPLYVVDGVILGSSMVDIDALDIESIEVVKGAAAASLYGSRAASGVIQIRTRRGASLGTDNIRFTLRTEYGTNQLPREFKLTKHHEFAMNAAGTQFIDASTGGTCDFLYCGRLELAGQDANGGAATAWNTYQENTYPGTTYDQVKRFFTGGNLAQQYVAAEGRSGNTNFHLSWTNLRQKGVMSGQDGESRNTFRINVDQGIGKFDVGTSAFYSSSKVDAAQGPLFDLTRMPAGVDLLKLNTCPPAPATCQPWQQPRLLPDGTQDPHDYYLQPDPFNNESPNPLYTTWNDNNYENRGRFLGSANARFSPFNWLSFTAQASYDRLDYRRQNYEFKGYKTTRPSSSRNNGDMLQRYERTQAFNASADMTLTHAFGDLRTRTQFRYLAEYDDWDWTQAGGNTFAVADVPTVSNLLNSINARSGLQPVRADGYFGITNLTYKDRYILDALVRNDGSSLFGPDSRRQWYYRVAGAWRIGQDLNIPGLDELKLRTAYGTAGGRPRFEAQYETYSISGGHVAPIQLGNRNLKPEFSAEWENGFDLLLSGRWGLTVDYSITTTKDQILQVPLPAYFGFESQWQNAGTLRSKTWEATLDLGLVQSRNVTWSAKVLFDRTRSVITKMNADVPPFTYGVSGQGLGDVFYARAGEQMGTFYGLKYATSCADLMGALPCDQFAVNSDGLLVWVGSGGSLSNPQWGTNGPLMGFHGQNQQLHWGGPVVGWGTDRVTGDTTNYLPIGKTMPDFHMAFSNTLRVKGLSVYGMLEWTKGISVYNEPEQWAVFRNRAGIQDQYGKAAADKKPLGYYNDLYGVAGLRPVNYFVQNASFAKLRELSLSYRFNRDQLAGISFLRQFQAVSIELIGRNLFTVSPYDSYDPEVGASGGDVGSAAIARVDGYAYPNFRTFSAAIQVTF